MGEKAPMQGLALGDLQQYVDRRARMKGLKGLVSPATIKKEIVTLRIAWNWAVQFGLVTGKFPQRGTPLPEGRGKTPVYDLGRDRAASRHRRRRRRFVGVPVPAER